MAAVSNNSPLILFAAIGRLDLFLGLFNEVLIPPAVWREVVTSGTGIFGTDDVQRAGWILQRTLPNREVPHWLATLHPGEAEAIALASSLGPAIPLLLDDRRARRVALQAGLDVIGCGGALVLAKKDGHIPSVRPILSDLIAAGLYLGEAARREILDFAGE